MKSNNKIRIPEYLGRIWNRSQELDSFERMPVDEITKMLKIESASGARGVLQTARRKLKAAMEEGNPNES